MILLTRSSEISITPVISHQQNCYGFKKIYSKKLEESVLLFKYNHFISTLCIYLKINLVN